MKAPINKGRSILNAADEMANPDGLILSEVERNYIYGKLNRLERTTNSIHEGKTGWRPQLKAGITAAWEFGTAALVVELLAIFWGGSSPRSRVSAFSFILAFIILQKLNLLLSHETIEETDARRDREDKLERKERARRFKIMGRKDLSLEEESTD
jgi:hypothetical protein